MIDVFFLSVAGIFLLYLAATRSDSAIALVAFLIPSYLLKVHLGPFPTNVFEVGVVLLLIGMASRTHAHRMWRASLTPGVKGSQTPGVFPAQWKRLTTLPRPVGVFVGLFLIAAIFSTVISPQLRVSLGILKGWVIVPLLFAAIVYVADQKTQRQVLRALVLSGAATALFGLLRITDYGLRITGFYDVPNSLALWLAPLLVIAVWDRTLFPIKLVRPVAIAVMAAALVATQSAAALVAVALALCIGGIFWTAGKTRAKLGVFLLAALVISTSYFLVTGRLAYYLTPWQTGTPNSLSVRAQLWSISWQLIREHPLRGVGLGQFEPAYQLKLHERFQEFENCSASWRMKIENCTRPLAEYVFRDPHNWVLSFWLNTGLLGIVSFTGIHLYLLWRLYKFSIFNFQFSKKSGQLPITNYRLQAPLLALCSLLLFGLVDTIYWKNDLAVLQWLLLAVAIRWVISEREQEKKTMAPELPMQIGD